MEDKIFFYNKSIIFTADKKKKLLNSLVLFIYFIFWALRICKRETGQIPLQLLENKKSWLTVDMSSMNAKWWLLVKLLEEKKASWLVSWLFTKACKPQIWFPIPTCPIFIQPRTDKRSTSILNLVM